LETETPQTLEGSDASVNAQSGKLDSVYLDYRAVADLSLIQQRLLPLDGFMTRDQYLEVLETGKVDGKHIGVPFLLPVNKDQVPQTEQIRLLSPYGDELARAAVLEVFKRDVESELRLLSGDNNWSHPLASEPSFLFSHAIGCAIQPLSKQDTLPEIRETKVVAFHYRNILREGHARVILEGLALLPECKTLLLSPVIGPVAPFDLHPSLVQAFLAETIDNLQRRLPAGIVVLPFPIPHWMRFASYREVVTHFVLRQRIGAQHLLVGREPAVAPGFKPHSFEIAEELFESGALVPVEGKFGSGTSIREAARDGRSDVVAEELLVEFESAVRITEYYARQGFCVWLYGPPGAGKTSVGLALVSRLLRTTFKHAYFLDAVPARQFLHPTLGLSPKDRLENNYRIARLARLLLDAGANVVVATVLPTVQMRQLVKSVLGARRVALIELFAPEESLLRRKGFLLDVPFESGECDLWLRTDVAIVDDIVEVILDTYIDEFAT